MIVLLLSACAGAPDRADSGILDTDPILAIEDLVPELAPDEIPTRFEAALRDDPFLPTDVYGWVDGIVDDLENDPIPECHRTPSEQPGWTTFALPEACIGLRYEIGGVLYVSEQVRDEGAQRFLQSVHLYSAYGELRDGSGEVTAGGKLSVMATFSEGSMALNANHGGAFADPSAHGTLADGASGNVTMEGVFHREAGPFGEFQGTMDAAFGGATALDLRDLSFRPGCSSPSGEARLRDPSSGWWTVQLPDDCTGCGRLSFGDADHGEACVGTLVKGMLDARLAAFADQEAP